MRFKNASECWKVILEKKDRKLLTEIEKFALKNPEKTSVSFGTSGWRGEIGTDFTCRNLTIVGKAIIRLLKTADKDVLASLGVSDFDDVRSRGVIVGHDNRFMGPLFSRIIISLLNKEGIRVFYAGETTTPEISASIEMLKAAASINITPSHNPANYQGIKFNPSDGGPAGKELTSLVQGYANEMMDDISEVTIPTWDEIEFEKIDTTSLYIDYLKERKTLDLERIRRFLNDEDILLVIDHVHGATRGRPVKLFGGDLLDDKIKLLRTEDDFLFGGVAPEPSKENMKEVERLLMESTSRFRLGVIMDPDGDRIRFCDHRMQIPMNYFGAMAFHFLYTYKGLNGVVVKSVGTSNFVNAIAEKHGIPVRETQVGFKNFRPYMLPDARERAVVAFEESDGISGYRHTLEKDALFGLLLALEMMAETGKNISEYLDDLFKEYGAFYPDRSGISVDRALVGSTLREKLGKLVDEFPEGSTLTVGEKTLKITRQITLDGLKLVLEDGSWLMIRPSGTEPKVRFYIEAREPKEKESLFQLAEAITRQAIERG